MKIFARSKRRYLLALVMLSLALTSCASYASHEWLDAPDWGRARLLDITEGGYPVVPAIDESGNSYFALSKFEADIPQIVVKSFDAALNPNWETLVELELPGRATRPSIIQTQKGLEVFWIQEEGLFSALLSPEGELLEEAHRISGNRLVSHYDVALSRAGERLLWFSGDRGDPGLFHVDPTGNITAVDFDGYSPQIAVGEDNSVYVIWLQTELERVQNHVFLGTYPNGHYVKDQARQIYTIMIAATAGLSGPEIALDEDSLYIFWAEESRTGPRAGQIESNYVAFPFERVQLISEGNLRFPLSHALNYVEYDAFLEAGQRALPQFQRVRSVASLIDIAANQVQGAETVLAMRTQLPYLQNDAADQVGLIFFEEGRITGYQLLSFTPRVSELPSIQADKDGFLYITWLEEGPDGDFRVYYSTTSPETNNILNVLSSEDVLRMAGDILFGIASGLVLLPFPVLWGLGPMIIVFLFGFLRKEFEPITAPGTLITVALSLFVYTYAKLFSMPGILDYVPFTAWVPVIPTEIYLPLRIGIPILTGLLGLYVAYRATYGRRNPAPLFFVGLFVVVDGLLTIAVYGARFYGTV